MCLIIYQVLCKMCALLSQTKIGHVNLMPNKQSKVFVQAELKPDVLQISKRNARKTLNVEIEQVHI